MEVQTADGKFTAQFWTADGLVNKIPFGEFSVFLVVSPWVAPPPSRYGLGPKEGGFVAHGTDLIRHQFGEQRRALESAADDLCACLLLTEMTEKVVLQIGNQRQSDIFSQSFFIVLSASR